jgi:hypothetical protein
MKRRIEEEIDDLGLDDKIRERRSTHIQEALSFLESEEQKILEHLDSEFSEFHGKLEGAIDRELSGLERQLSELGSRQKEGQERGVSGRAQQAVSACGKRTLTRVQSRMRSDIARIQKELSHQMTRSLGKAENQLSGQTSSLMIEDPGFDNLVTVYTDRSVEEREVVDRVQTQLINDSSSGDDVMKAGVYGLMAGFLIAPWAILPAFVLTGGLGGNQNRSQVQKVFKTVKDYFVTQSVDAGRAVSELRDRLSGSSEQAVETMKERTRSDVKSVFSAKVAELRDRMSDLNESTREDVDREQKKTHAEQLLKKISQIPLTLPTD